MSIELKHFNDTTVTPKDDARVNHLKIADSGVISGCVVTSLGANQLHITDGYGIIQGRLFNIAAQDISATVSDSGTKRGRLIVAVDLTNVTTPIAFDTQMAVTLPELVQEDLNDDGTDYELALAEYDISTTTISNLEDVSTQVNGKIKEADIEAGVVTNTKIGTNAITSTKINAGAVTENAIGTGAVTKSKLHADALDWTLIATSGVLTSVANLTIASQAGKSEMMLQLRDNTGTKVWACAILPLDASGLLVPTSIQLVCQDSTTITDLDARSIATTTATNIAIGQSRGYTLNGATYLQKLYVFTR